MLTLCLSLLSPLAGSNYLKPLHEPMSKMLQMLQECSQLELALRVLLNSHGSCLQHITSNMMDMNLSMQVQRPHQCRRIAVCLLSWQFFTLFFFSSMRNECWWIIMCLWTKSRRPPARLWTLWLWHYYKRPVKMECCVCFSFFFGLSVLNNYVVHFLCLQVFNWRVVDCDLAVGLCTLLSQAEVFKTLWKVIDGTWQNYDKILVGSIQTFSLLCICLSALLWQYTVGS